MRGAEFVSFGILTMKHVIEKSKQKCCLAKKMT
jgi:hypothetical protein